MTLDFVEFLLTSLIESVLDKIELILFWLLKLKATNKGGEVIIEKTHEIIKLTSETLSADIILPNLVALLNADMNADGI